MSVINAQKWKEILEVVVKSQANEKGRQPLPSQYVVVNGKQYQYAEQDKIGERKKLSVKEVVNVSKEALEGAAKEKDVDWEKLEKQTTEITNYLQQLVEAREGKRNQRYKRFFRTVALILSAVASVVLIGIPFLILLRRADQKFALEIQSLRKELFLLRYNPKIQQELGHLPSVLENLPRFIKDDNRQEQLQQQLQKDLKESELGKIAPQFKKDMNRGVSFQRKDETLKIKDSLVQPSLKLAGERRIKQGQALLKRLLKSEQDKKWEQVLQLVASQTSLNTLFDQIILFFNLDAGMNSDLHWEDQGNSYALKTAFSEQLPPIEIEVIRNAQKNIEKIKVRVKGALDIGYYNTRNGEIIEAVAPKAIKGELEYEVTLVEDHSPVVSGLKTRLEANLKLQ